MMFASRTYSSKCFLVYIVTVCRTSLPNYFFEPLNTPSEKAENAGEIKSKKDSLTGTEVRLLCRVVKNSFRLVSVDFVDLGFVMERKY